MTKNLNFPFFSVALLIGFAAARSGPYNPSTSQQSEKRITLPPVTVSQLNIIVTALQTCDCPSKSTPELLNSFVSSARQQAPEWFGLKADSTKKGGKP